MQYFNVLFFVFCVECACEITIPLKDMEEFENETVVFALSLSKPRVVEWMKNSQAISEDERVKKYASKDGLKHALTIFNITLDDKGVYTSRIDDLEYGFMESSSSLLVKGSSEFLGNLLLQFRNFYAWTIVFCLDLIKRQIKRQISIEFSYVKDYDNDNMIGMISVLVQI